MDEVADLLGCHPVHVRRLAKRGVLPTVRIGSRFTRYPLSAVEKLMRPAGGHGESPQ